MPARPRVSCCATGPSPRCARGAGRPAGHWLHDDRRADRAPHLRWSASPTPSAWARCARSRCSTRPGGSRATSRQRTSASFLMVRGALDQQATTGGRGSSRPPPADGGRTYSAGKSTRISKAMDSPRRRARASPRHHGVERSGARAPAPRPLPPGAAAARPRRNGSKMRARSSGGMPGPESRTSRCARGPRRTDRTSIVGAVARGILDQVAHEPSQEPRILKAHQHRHAAHVRRLVAGRLLGREREQVHVLAHLESRTASSRLASSISSTSASSSAMSRFDPAPSSGFAPRPRASTADPDPRQGERSSWLALASSVLCERQRAPRSGRRPR